MVGRRSRMLRPLALVALLLMVPGAASGLSSPYAQDGADDDEPINQDDDDVPLSHLRGIAVGDHWTFRITGDQSGEIRNQVVDEHVKRSDHFERNYPAYKIEAQGHVTSEELGPLGETRYEIRGLKWVRATDYATIQVEGQSTVHDVDNSDARESFEAPLVDLVHPFTTGYEWVATSDWWVEPENRPRGQQGIAMTVQQRVVVEGMETVTVPAGTFDAWRLNYTSFRPGGGFALRWHVDEVCDFVREDAFDKHGALKHRLTLTDYSCTASIVDQPVYDTRNVTLVSRGILGGPTGEQPPRPTQDDGTETAESGTTWLWPALGVTLAVGAVLVAIGRRRA